MHEVSTVINQSTSQPIVAPRFPPTVLQQLPDLFQVLLQVLHLHRKDRSRLRSHLQRTHLHQLLEEPAMGPTQIHHEVLPNAEKIKKRPKYGEMERNRHSSEVHP